MSQTQSKGKSKNPKKQLTAKLMLKRVVRVAELLVEAQSETNTNPPSKTQA